MKHTLPLLTLVAVSIALPAFAEGPKKTSTSTTTTVVERTYATRPVKVPLTPEQVAERQRIGTWLESRIKRIDTDNDREISRQEFAYGGDVFDLNVDKTDRMAFYDIDTNHDGNLSSQELLKAKLAQKYGDSKNIIVYEDQDVTHITTSAGE